MDCKRIIFSGHAVRQMFRRELKKKDVLEVIYSGEVIIDYPNDTPYPSCLILGFVKDMPVHVVCAIDQQHRTGIVITAYIPNAKLWTENFKTRRTR